MNNIKLTLNRDITPDEFPWLYDLAAALKLAPIQVIKKLEEGKTVFKYDGLTGDSLLPNEIAVVLRQKDNVFFALPIDATDYPFTKQRHDGEFSGIDKMMNEHDEKKATISSIVDSVRRNAIVVQEMKAQIAEGFEGNDEVIIPESFIAPPEPVTVKMGDNTITTNPDGYNTWSHPMGEEPLRGVVKDAYNQVEDKNDPIELGKKVDEMITGDMPEPIKEEEKPMLPLPMIPYTMDMEDRERRIVDILNNLKEAYNNSNFIYAVKSYVKNYLANMRHGVPITDNMFMLVGYINERMNLCYEEAVVEYGNLVNLREDTLNEKLQKAREQAQVQGIVEEIENKPEIAPVDPTIKQAEEALPNIFSPKYLNQEVEEKPLPMDEIPEVKEFKEKAQLLYEYDPETATVAPKIKDFIEEEVDRRNKHDSKVALSITSKAIVIIIAIILLFLVAITLLITLS